MAFVCQSTSNRPVTHCWPFTFCYMLGNWVSTLSKSTAVCRKMTHFSYSYVHYSYGSVLQHNEMKEWNETATVRLKCWLSALRVIEDVRIKRGWTVGLIALLYFYGQTAMFLSVQSPDLSVTQHVLFTEDKGEKKVLTSNWLLWICNQTLNMMTFFVVI